MKNVLKPLLFICLGIFIWTSCDSDGEEATSLDFQFVFMVDNENLELGKTYQLGGTTVQLETARFYVGGIELQSRSGITSFEDLYLLVKAEETEYEVGNIELADYTGVKFFVGIDPEANSQAESDFTTRSSADPLGIQDPSMHWNWNSGYKFIRIDGQTDTDGDGVVDTPLAFHIGTDGLLSSMEFATPSLQEGSNTLDFQLDLNRLYEDIDLTVDWDTHTGNNFPLAEQFLANFQSALTLN